MALVPLQTMLPIARLSETEESGLRYLVKLAKRRKCGVDKPRAICRSHSAN